MKTEDEENKSKTEILREGDQIEENINDGESEDFVDFDKIRTKDYIYNMLINMVTKNRKKKHESF